MKRKTFNKAHLQQVIAHFSLLCLFFSSQVPSSLFAEDPTYIDEDAARRTQNARILVGVTVVALGAGIAYAVSGSSGKCHHHHHSSSSSSSYSSNSSSSASSSSSHHSHSSSHHSSSSNSSYSGNYFLDPNNRGSSSSFSDQNGTVGLGPQFAPRSHMLKKSSKRSHDSSSEHSLSGMFISNVATRGQGSISAFVQLPDGTTQHLGHIPFSGSTSSSLAYGPFNQEGTYTFGISIDEGSQLPAQTKIGSVNIEVNGSMTQSYDFMAPANPSANYEPPTSSYTLHST
jgi:hypothetical protein